METREVAKLEEYNRLRNQVRDLTRKNKIYREREVAKNIKKDPKKFWKFVNSKMKTKGSIPDLEITEDGTTNVISEDQEKAQQLVKYFSSVFTLEPEGTAPNLGNPLPVLFNPSPIVTEEKVKKKIQTLKLDKSPGPDQISTFLLKEAMNQLIQPLCILFNQSLQSGKLPSQWKKANVCAIHKKGSRKKCDNYRPVSLTSVVCKILESLIRDAIMDHMLQHNLFSKFQYGFLPGRSTVLQLLKILDKWTEAMDNGYQIEVIYLDFRKAFDTVPHKRLINKIRHYGIVDPVLQWIKDFLSDRTQKVVIRDKYSNEMAVSSGIPQGSVLGPVLFLIYINDLPSVVKHEAFIFADDTKLCRTSKEQDNDIQEDLRQLDNWSEKWLLQFNPTKCKQLVIRRSGSNTPNERHLYDRTEEKYIAIPYVKSEKDLGITVDDQLNFKEHIGNCIRKASRNMGLIRRTFSHLDKEMFVPLYTSLVRSHLEYAEAVWNPHLIGDIKRLEAVQRNATKQVNGLKDKPYQERLKILNLPTLACRRDRGDMIEVYKIIHNLYEQQCAPPLVRSHTSTRGHLHKLFKQRTLTLNIRKNFFTNRVVDLWNSLPAETVEAPSLNSFKSSIDKHWRRNGRLYNVEGLL